MSTPYRVEQTHNRHSRAVYRNGEIIIRLARWLGSRERQEHIDTLLKRMRARVMKEQNKKRIDPFSAFLNGAQNTVVQIENGERYTIDRKDGATLKATVSDYCISVLVPGDCERRQIHRELWKVLSQDQLPRIEHLIEHINAQTYGVSVDRVRLRVATSRWGSCSSTGTIMLNTALLFVPEHLLRYVIIHELAHCNIPNHSPRFWKLVEQACPSYKEDRKELREWLLPNWL